MGIRRQDAISCRGGFSVHVRRGEDRILEMERHRECLREQLNLLETMLPPSSNNFNNQEGEPETDDQEGYSKIDEKKLDEDQACVLQSLAVKEKKLRDEIFIMECKGKEYLQTLSKANVQQSNGDEMQKVEDSHDFTRVDNSPRNRKGESVEKEKISQLEVYSKKLCDCLRSIQNNRKVWSQQAGDLSKELNCFENPELVHTPPARIEDPFGDSKPEGCEGKGNKCPCGEPVKCNSCIICNCSDWEQDLKIDVQGKPEEFKELKQKEVDLAKKKSDCRCFQSSSDSNHSSMSLEISNIYKCSMSKMQSDMSIATPSIPSTVDGVITGNEEDKKNYCSLCKQEDRQTFCEICLCEWKRDYKTNQQLYLDEDDRCNLCDICNEERFRGGTDFKMSINKESSFENLKENLKENLTSIFTPSTLQPEIKIREIILHESEKILSSTYPSQFSKNLEIEELKKNLQNLENGNNVIRKWIEDQNNHININPSKDEIIAALVDEIKQTPISIRSKIWEQSQKKRHLGYEILTKDLALGLFILLLTFLSYFLGFSGFFSLSLIFKVFFQILTFPFQTCTQISKNFPILYDTFRNFIFNYSKTIINFFRNMTSVREENFEISLILICISVFFALIVTIKFVFVNCGKFSNSRLGVIVLSFAKKIMNFFVRPIIVLLIFIKFVLLFSITLSFNLISFCVPRMIINLTYRMMNSSINILLVLFKRKSGLSCTLNLICIILGFLFNKISNLSEFKVVLGSLREFLNSFLYNTPELDKTKNLSDDWVNQLLKPSNFFSFFNMFIENIIELPKLIFRTFEIM